MGARPGNDDGDEFAVNHDINVTPFIDVMLVLLIIFMVAAPLSTVDVPVELPVATAEPVKRPAEPVFITIKADETLAIGEATVTADALPGRITAATGGNTETRLYLRADRKVAYGRLMDVMNVLRSSGYLKVGLVGLENEGDAADGG